MPTILPDNREKTHVVDEQQKEQESRSVEQTEAFDSRSTEKIEENEQRISSLEPFAYSCYHCTDFQANNKYDYEHHVISKHGLGHPCYPCKADLERLGLKAQRKNWEISYEYFY